MGAVPLGSSRAGRPTGLKSELKMVCAFAAREMGKTLLRKLILTPKDILQFKTARSPRPGIFFFLAL